MGYFKKKPDFNKVDSLIGSETVFEGKLDVYGSIRIDGTVYGNIECQGTVVLGTEGKVTGDIVADSAIIGGEIVGNVTARTRLEIVSKGKLVGDIHTSHLIIADGVIFEGSCHMLTCTPDASPSGGEEVLLSAALPRGSTER